MGILESNSWVNQSPDMCHSLQHPHFIKRKLINVGKVKGLQILNGLNLKLLACCFIYGTQQFSKAVPVASSTLLKQRWERTGNCVSTYVITFFTTHSVPGSLQGTGDTEPCPLRAPISITGHQPSYARYYSSHPRLAHQHDNICALNRPIQSLSLPKGQGERNNKHLKLNCPLTTA